MQTTTEYLIWDKIVASAKSRFDAKLYSNKFKNLQPESFDKLILHIIVGFASGEDHESIAVKDRKSTRLNSSHVKISYAVFCLKKKRKKMWIYIMLISHYRCL